MAETEAVIHRVAWRIPRAEAGAARPRVPRLEEGDVHLWLADTTSLTPLPGPLSAILSAGEHARARRFHFTADRSRFEIGRALLRLALGLYTDVRPQGLAFRCGPHGKPVLGSMPASRVRFNVTHSGDLVLLAFTLDREIGIDIEAEREVADVEGVARSCFSLAERRWIFGEPRKARRRFFEYWAAKESWIKADGRGLSLPLGDFTISPTPVSAAYVVKGPAGATLDWHVRSLRVRSGYAAALTVRGPVNGTRTLWIDVLSAVHAMNSRPLESAGMPCVPSVPDDTVRPQPAVPLRGAGHGQRPRAIACGQE